MLVGVVRSYNSSFFSFKDNKILIKLTDPVYQIVIREKTVNCTSKKVEFRLTEDLTAEETFIMGRKIEMAQFKKSYNDLKSNFWLSTTVDSSDLQAKLNGMAETCEGKVLFLNEFVSLNDSLEEILKSARQQTVVNKGIIREYCDKNIQLLNNQIRLLNQEKNVFQELMGTL